MWALIAPAVFVGGSWGGGGCGGPRRRRYVDEGYGYGRRRPRRYESYRVGPSCGQLLACNCCANLACNSCCCGSDCTDA